MKNIRILRMGPRSSFNPGREITDPSRLYGRCRTLESLKAALVSGTHTEVVAQRKFGKSSVLKCLANSLREIEGVLVAYVGVESLTCSDWSDFYRWILAYLLAATGSKSLAWRARVAEELAADNLEMVAAPGTPAEIFPKIEMDNPEDVLGKFSHFLRALSEIDTSAILLLDESSFALKHFHGDAARFHFLRHLAMQNEMDRNKALTVCISDRVGWDQISEENGASPALNFVSNHVNLGGITENDAIALLRTHAAACTPPFDMNDCVLRSILDIASPYPFYLKIVAEKAYLQASLDGRVQPQQLEEESYVTVRGHMMHYLRACDSDERQVLKRIITSPVKSEEMDPPLRRLTQRGLLKTQCEYLRPFNNLFRLACREAL